MNYLVTSYSYIYVTCMITKVTQTCIALWFIFFVPPVSHESMRMAWFLFGPKCRVWCLFGGAQSIKHKPPVKTQDLCKFSQENVIGRWCPTNLQHSPWSHSSGHQSPPPRAQWISPRSNENPMRRLECEHLGHCLPRLLSLRGKRQPGWLQFLSNTLF